MKYGRIALAVAATGAVAVGAPAMADTATTHAGDCPSVSACSFAAIDGNGAPATWVASKYKDTISNAGNEVQVLTGTGLANDTGAAVTYGPATLGSAPCYSLTTGKTTLNWTAVIQTNGSWNLTCNFSKKA